MTIIPELHRPIFDGLETPEEKWKASMAEYEILKETDEDGLDFSNKTAMWIAYERQIESNREDSLFKDPLAEYFVEPYGKRLSDSMAMGTSIGVFDPPGANIGLGFEGHVMYTAARTKLINNSVDEWILELKKDSTNLQVLNLGVGFDTRAYWLSSLRNVSAYWEVDTASVMSHKQTILDQLKEKDLLPETLCPRKAISMDFAKESVSDLVTAHSFETAVATCWILEGLIMYLERADVEELLDKLSTMSCSKSLLILNFSNNVPNGPSIDEIDTRLEKNGWEKEQTLMFGDEGFQFDRYPDGKPANKQVGFAMYRKT